MIGQKTRINTRAAVAAAGTSVLPTIVIPDNCHTIIFLNRHATQIILIGQGTPGPALADDGTNSVIPGAGTLTWQVGVITLRPDNMQDLIYDTVGNQAANCDITYLCSTGGDR